jgi:hypothetical protein
MWSIRPDGSEATQHTNLDERFFLNFPVVSPDGSEWRPRPRTREGGLQELTTATITKGDVLPRLPDSGPFWPQSWSP